MSATPYFPNDENGRILQQMHDRGDDLTQPRVVDFFFVFPDRDQALAFIREVDDKTAETCLSWYRGKSMWQVIVKYDMVPDYARITAIESTVTLKAKDLGGRADGWGCMQISRR